MNIRKEFKSLVLPILRGLPIIIVLMVIAFFLAMRIVMYSIPMYQATGSLRIDNRDMGVNDFELFDKGGGKTATSNFLTEVEMFRSLSLKEKVFKKLNFDISYYRYGKIRTEELYNQSPFLIDYEVYDEAYYDELFALKYEGKGFFVLTVDEKTHKLKFGESYDNSKKFKLTISKNNDQLKINRNSLLGGDKFGFRFNTTEKLARSINEKNLFVKPLEKNVDIVKIYYQDEVPEKTALFVNAIIDAYIEQDRETKSAKASKTLAFIDKEIADVKGKLYRSELELANFREKESVINTTQETEAMLRKFNSLDKEKINYDLQELELKNVYEFLISEKSFSSFSPDFKTINDDVFESTYLKLKDLELDLTDMLLKYPETSDEVITTRAKIEDLKKFTLESVQKRLLNIADKRNEIYSSINDLEADFKKFPGKERKLAILQRDFQLYEQTYKTLVKKRTELGITNSSNVTFHKVIDYAVVPQKPISPNKALIVGLSMFLAMLLGVGLSYLVNFYRAKVTSIDDVEDKWQFPVIASIKKMGRKNGTLNPFLNLYTNLDKLSLLDDHKIISISSSQKGDGKTMVTAQLGKLLADYGKSVLLIDMNFDKPELHKVFNIENQQGISEVLNENVHPELVMKRNIHRDLDFIPLGKNGYDHSTMIFSPETEAFLDRIKSDYDVVLIDTAEALNTPDAAGVMRCSDACLFVIRKGKTKLRNLPKSKSYLEAFKISNVQLVLNSTN